MSYDTWNSGRAKAMKDEIAQRSTGLTRVVDARTSISLAEAIDIVGSELTTYITYYESHLNFETQAEQLSLALQVLTRKVLQSCSPNFQEKDIEDDVRRFVEIYLTVTSQAMLATAK